MRKVIWCCTAAGVLAASSFLSLAYYACRYPESLVGRSMQVIAEASLAMQPLNGLSVLATHRSQTNPPDSEPAGSIEECIPDDPQPAAPEAKKKEVVLPKEIEAEAAPIVIGEEDAMPREEAVRIVPGPVDDKVVQGCPIVMPYCPDDEEPMTPPGISGADAGNNKSARADTEEADFQEWMKLFDADKKDMPSTAEELPVPAEVEELPAPTEIKESQAEPKCQEDSHLHEHYSGCPRVTCPYTGKSYPSCTPATKSGTEEASEEPPQESKKTRRSRVGKAEELPAPSVDTMEYRKSDAGLNEYGPGPLH